MRKPLPLSQSRSAAKTTRHIGPLLAYLQQAWLTWLSGLAVWAAMCLSRARVCVRVCVCACVRVCECVCASVCVCVYVCA